jgi:hypothetical protein
MNNWRKNHSAIKGGGADNKGDKLEKKVKECMNVVWL